MKYHRGGYILDLVLWRRRLKEDRRCYEKYRGILIRQLKALEQEVQQLAVKVKIQHSTGNDRKD